MLSFKPTFSLSSFTFIKRLFSSSLSAIRVVSYVSVSQFSRSIVSDSLQHHEPCMPGLPVHHQLLESTQIHIHCVPLGSQLKQRKNLMLMSSHIYHHLFNQFSLVGIGLLPRYVCVCVYMLTSYCRQAFNLAADSSK